MCHDLNSSQDLAPGLRLIRHLSKRAGYSDSRGRYGGELRQQGLGNAFAAGRILAGDQQADL